MRHGNFFVSWNIRSCKPFRSYLWGMETLPPPIQSAFPGTIPILPMRHGNSSCSKIVNSCCLKIPILPMRHGNMENFINSFTSKFLFRSYLWGMETRIMVSFPISFYVFRSYLWGMETLQKQRLLFRYRSIPILPMRHGNCWIEIEPRILVVIFRSYLWGMETFFLVVGNGKYFKLFRSYLWGMETPIKLMRLRSVWEIPILPMRHGNYNITLSSKPALNAFRSYLWGMETRRFGHWQQESPWHSDPTYEAWKLTYIKLIQCRNLCHSDPTYEAWKLNRLVSHQRPSINSDPTYEAWKRTILNGLGSVMNHSDPTYEAWKQFFQGLKPSVHRPHSDPTYEAWKLISFFFSSNLKPIPILPMRHGNRKGLLSHRFSCWIPILPMRHGNLTVSFVWEWIWVFRSYLWGMETRIMVSFPISFYVFRSYLWGMETPDQWYIEGRRNEFRSYLWGMETKLRRYPHLHRAVFRSYLWGMETKFL